MAFLYSILPEYTRNSDVLTDNNIKGKVKALEEFMDTIDEEIFDIVSDSVKEILSFGSIDRINDEYLPYISYLLGYKWNYNLDSGIQRNLLNNILELYKRKGTKFSFNFSLYNLDPSITLYEPYNDIFILNKSGFDEFDYNSYSNFIWRAPVRVATTEKIVLSGIQVIDGVTVRINDRVLVKNQDNIVENGVYIVKDDEWVRSDDADLDLKLFHSLYFVSDGLINKNKGWVCTQASLTEGIIFDILKYKKAKKYYLPNNNYYSWGIIVLRINNLNSEIYELLSLIKPAGWKILIELRHGLYYNFNLKADNIVRNNYIDSYGLSILDFGEDENYYNTFINSIHYSTIKTFIDIVFMGQIFDLKGNYFGSTVNNNITLEHIEHYNLYYETENNNYTLLRYSSHYTGYTHLYVVFMGSSQCYDLYLNSYSTIYEGIPI